ncbi:hypothetical protein DPMN_175077 [Dreissena polymorpha]|uniref:Uncharacterized protein n=1 Tax=Dreissena polymorpha TaxID=45954 RepID=A0A9D4E4I0_DREPO|nr:hypothetical protein DPMN_175077 [Dreissena polymorpha]
MMAEGPRVILRLPTIRQTVIASPEPMLWFSMIRMEVEMLNLAMMTRIIIFLDQNHVVHLSDALIQDMRRHLLQVLLEVIWVMLLEGSAVGDDMDMTTRIFM